MSLGQLTNRDNIERWEKVVVGQYGRWLRMQMMENDYKDDERRTTTMRKTTNDADERQLQTMTTNNNNNKQQQRWTTTMNDNDKQQQQTATTNESLVAVTGKSGCWSIWSLAAGWKKSHEIKRMVSIE